LALPADFREELGGKCYLRCHPDGYVSITSNTEFEAAAAQLKDRVRSGEAPESALRAFGVNSSVASIDKQGRITLDEQIRAHAGITPGGQAVIAGAVTQLQVWRPSRYRTIRSEDGIVQPSRVWTDEEGDS
jgi:MraZ protein